MILDFRKIENLHILLWLLKDLCWVADWKIMGTVMILPTIGVAFWLTWKMRSNYAELMHNLAVIFWIFANATWMLGEFYWNDGTRLYAMSFFIIGLVFLAIFYFPLIVKKRD